MDFTVVGSDDEFVKNSLSSSAETADMIKDEEFENPFGYL